MKLFREVVGAVKILLVASHEEGNHSSFVGRCSVIAELEQRYQLAWGFQPRQFEELVTLVSGMVADPGLEATMAQRHARVLAEKVDLTEWLLEQFDSGFA